MTYVGWSMPEFANLTLGMAISHETGGRTWAHVIDDTGLSGRFDFSLAYDMGYHAMMNAPMPESMRAHLSDELPALTTRTSGSSIFPSLNAIGARGNAERPGARVPPARNAIVTVQRPKRRGPNGVSKQPCLEPWLAS